MGGWKRAFRRLAIGWLVVLAVALPAQVGCGTVYNLAGDGGRSSLSSKAPPQAAVYGGVRQDLYWIQELGQGLNGVGWAYAVFFELALSLTADTLLLPITIPHSSP